MRIQPLLFIALLAAAIATVKGQQPALNPSDSVQLQLPSNPVQDVVYYYENLTGKRLILDSALQGPNLSITANQNVTRSEAIALIESALLLNGYTLVPVDDKTSKLLGPSKQAKSESIPLFTDVSQLPDSEGVVSFFMPFRYIKIDEAAQVFNQYVTVRPFGSIVPVPSVNALVITENVPLVRRLVGLKGMIDVEGGRTTTEFIILQRADAERVAEILSKLFENEADRLGSPNAATPTTPAAPPVPAPDGSMPAPPETDASGVAIATVGQKVQIVPDPRTNRIMVVAPESRMLYIRELIANLDVAVNFEAPLERQLRFASAGEILPVIGNLLAEGDDKVETTGSSASGTNNASNAGGADGGGASLGGGSSSAGGSGGTKPDRLRAPTQSTAPESISVGKSRIIADRSSNKIIVIGPPESRAKAERVIDMLDQRPKQVYLAVVIGQLTLGNGIDFGIDYLIRYGDVRILGQGSAANIGNLLTNRNVGVDLLPGTQDAVNTGTQLAGAALPLVSGLTVFGSIGDSVDIYARALASTNRFQVISRPVVYAANNQKAVISSGQSVPVPQSTLSSVVGSGGINNDTSNAITSNIEYKDVVLKLEVIPLINSKDEVTLTIAQQNDNIQGQQEISNNEVPIIGTQELTTTVTVPNRHTIILGGLITDEETRLSTGIPLLKDIPGLGYLFSSTKKDTVRRELIVMIQPFIIDSPAALNEANAIERKNSSFQDGLYEKSAPLAPGNVPALPELPPRPEKPFGERP